jgi:tripeptide aminopeptidase
MDSITGLFKTLVQIDSPSGEEQSAAQFVLEYLQNLGLHPELDEYGMIYCRIGNEENPKLFCSHMDTVEPGKGINVIEKDGYLQSNEKTILGGDNKASLSAILYSVKELVENDDSINIELLFSVREETDSGIQQFDAKRLESKIGFVFDAGNGDLGWITTSAPTLHDIVIEIHGRSSHASRPENGINTLEILMDMKEDLKLGRLDEFTTFNLGLISGGDATNTVPSMIRLSGDLRSTDSERFEIHKDHIENICNKYSKKWNTQIRVLWKPYAFGYTIDTQSEHYKKLEQFYKSLDISLNPNPTTSASDAGFLNHCGITTFCLGDGVENIHQTSERIEISKLSNLQKIVKTLMREFKT